QEAEAVGKDLEHALRVDETVLLGLRLEDLEDQLLLAQAADVLDVHLAGNGVEVGDALFFQLGEVHPSGGRLSCTFVCLVAAVASVSAGAVGTGPGGGVWCGAV